MAQKISLRAYLDKLDKLLSANATDEVIFHCRHLLQGLPKNAAVYRTLGRALLYNSRWNEAGPVLRRVLSVYPDDYVAHIGLSETERAQSRGDSAIWHLERAYEHEPGNAPLITTLRDFYHDYKQTDLARLQLTAGALGRQYMRQGRAQEAADTLREALERNANRPDLQVAMIQALWNNDQRIEAAEMALDMLDVLPDALVPNRILSELWLSEGRPSDAQRFITHVEAVEPYLALELASGETIPDEAVLVDEADYQRYIENVLMNEQPDWLREISGEEYAGLLREEAENNPGTMQVPGEWLTQTDQLKLRQKTYLPESPREANPYIDLSFDDRLDDVEAPEPTAWTAARDMEEATPSLARASKPKEPAESIELPSWLTGETLPAMEDTEAAAEQSDSTDSGDDPMAWLRESGIAIDDSANRPSFLYDEETNFVHAPVSPNAWMEESGIEIRSTDEMQAVPVIPPAASEALNELSADDDPLGWMENFPDLSFDVEPMLDPVQQSPFELEEINDSGLSWLDTFEEPARAAGDSTFDEPIYAANDSTIDVQTDIEPAIAEDSEDDFGWLHDPALMTQLDAIVAPAAPPQTVEARPELDETDPSQEPSPFADESDDWWTPKDNPTF